MLYFIRDNLDYHRRFIAPLAPDSGELGLGVATAGDWIGNEHLLALVL